jgi:hypothetical protein
MPRLPVQPAFFIDNLPAGDTLTLRYMTTGSVKMRPAISDGASRDNQINIKGIKYLVMALADVPLCLHIYLLPLSHKLSDFFAVALFVLPDEQVIYHSTFLLR